MPISGGLLALQGIAEGLKSGLLSYRDESRYQDRREADEEERKARALEREGMMKDRAMMQKIAARKAGYTVNPDTGDLELSPEGLEEKDRQELEMDLGLLKTMPEDYRIGSPTGRGIYERVLNRGSRRRGLLGADTSVLPVEDDAEPEEQAESVPTRAPAVMPNKPQGTRRGNASSGGGLMQLDPGFVTSRQRKLQDDITKALAIQRGKNKINAEAMEDPALAKSKLSTEGKLKVGQLYSGLEALDNYEKFFSKGQRQKFLNQDTPLVGGLIGSTPIDDTRVHLEEALGRLASGGAITKHEEVRFRQMIPRWADDDKEARRKMKTLRREMSTKLKMFGLKPPGRGPAVGTVVDGMRFMGGDPNDQSSWEPE